MTITVPDDQAKQLLDELTGSRSAAARDLTAKLKAGLARNKGLTTDELQVVLHVLDSVAHQVLPEPDGMTRVDFVLVWRSAAAKVRALWTTQKEREQEGRRS